MKMIFQVRGLAMADVLFANAICAFSLVAIMKMQIFSLQQTDTANRHFSLAFHSSILIGKMRHNPRFSNLYLGTFTASSITGSCDTDCSSSAIASADVSELMTHLQRVVRQPSVEIQQISLGTFQLSVRWLEDMGSGEVVPQRYRQRFSL